MNRQNQRNWDNNPNNQFYGGYDYGYYTSGNPDDNMNRNRNFEENNYPDQNFRDNSYHGRNFGYNDFQNRNSRQNNYANQNSGYNNYQDQNFGYNNDYQNAGNNRQHRPYYPSVSGVYEDDFGGNDHGYAGGNPGFENEVDEYKGYGADESNNNFGVGTGRNQGYYEQRNNWQPNSNRGFERQNEYNSNNFRNQNRHALGQTMDSWDNDVDHWRTHKFLRGHFGRGENNNNQDLNYRPQNQGYFGENIPQHSGGNLYSDRFRNNESRARYNNEEGRWHADSLSDGNIESWGR
jgi:hypothetical protein